MGSGVLSHRLVLATVGGVGLDQPQREMDGGQFLITTGIKFNYAAFTLDKYAVWKICSPSLLEPSSSGTEFNIVVQM